MSNEVVKYHNDLNTVVMRTWTSEEMNFFFAILTKAKEQGLKKLVFDTDELKQLASSSRNFEMNLQVALVHLYRIQVFSILVL